MVAAHEAQLLYERAERRTITGQRDEGRQDLAAAQKSLVAAKTEVGEKLKTAQDRIARLEADMNAARGAEQHQKALVSAADKALAAEKTRSERLESDVSAARQAVSAAERAADARDAEWKAALPITHGQLSPAHPELVEGLTARYFGGIWGLNTCHQPP